MAREPLLNAIEVGKNIREHRKSQKVSQKVLAKSLKITPQYLCSIENGKFLPSGILMKEIFESLGMKLKVIVE